MKFFRACSAHAQKAGIKREIVSNERIFEREEGSRRSFRVNGYHLERNILHRRLIVFNNSGGGSGTGNKTRRNKAKLLERVTSNRYIR